MIIETIHLYEDKKDITLTTYIVAEQGELSEVNPRPAVLICPGGGYFNCSDREAEPIALQFAVLGYHAFVLRYSTYTEGKPDLPEFGKPIPVKKDRTHPAPVRDIGKAMLYIYENAQKWHVDTDRIAVCGFSAGGHNSAMYGVYWDKPLITDYFGVEKEMLKPAAMILGYPITDYIFLRDTEKAPMDKEFFDNSNHIFIGEENDSDEILESVSPARLVSESTPPAFIWATAGDNLVPAQHSIRMAHALADKKIPFELHIFEEGDHGLSTATQAAAIAKSQINEDVAQWITLAGKWLEKRFRLDMPDITPFEAMMANK